MTMTLTMKINSGNYHDHDSDHDQYLNITAIAMQYLFYKKELDGHMIVLGKGYMM